MCWGQSPGTRTIATSRSEATTTESEPDDETKARAQGPPRPTNPKAMRRPPGATSTESRGGEPFPLDRLFQERPHRPAALAVPPVDAAGAGFRAGGDTHRDSDSNRRHRIGGGGSPRFPFFFWRRSAPTNSSGSFLFH